MQEDATGKKKVIAELESQTCTCLQIGILRA